MRSPKAIAILVLAWILVIPGASLAEEATEAGGLTWLGDWAEWVPDALAPSALELLTDDAVEVGKFRLQLYEKGAASGGPSGTYFGQEQSAVWGAGLYGKLAVDPNRNVPGLDQLAAVTAWARDAGLPVSDPYLLAEPYWVDYTEDAGAVLLSGVGLLVADHIVVEFTYDVVDGGTIDTGRGAPPVSSGWDLWLGFRVDFK